MAQPPTTNFLGQEGSPFETGDRAGLQRQCLRVTGIIWGRCRWGLEKSAGIPSGELTTSYIENGNL